MVTETFSQIEIKEKLKPGQVAVVSATRYSEYHSGNNGTDTVRGDLALSNIENYLIKGYSVFLIDKESSPEFLLRINKLKKEHSGLFVQPQVSEQSGSSIPRLEGIEMALKEKPGSQIICLVESEKPLVDSIPLMIKPIVEKEADIVLSDRGIRWKPIGDEVTDFRNYTHIQAGMERQVNVRITRELKDAGLLEKNTPVIDLMNGTRVIKNDPNLVELLRIAARFKVPKESKVKGWVKPEDYGISYYSIPLALTLGYKVGQVNIDFQYPETQRQNEEGSPNFYKKRLGHYMDIPTAMSIIIEFLAKHNELKTLPSKSQAGVNYLKQILKNNPIDTLGPNNMVWN